MKTQPAPSWTTAAANFFYLASARLAPIVALASTGFANPDVVLVSALRGVQLPEGEATEISLL
jgi:hypothetical protein